MSELPTECDCPEDTSGIFPPGIKNHTNNCPVLAWFHEIGKVVDAEDYAPQQNGGFIGAPTLQDINRIDKSIAEIRRQIDEIKSILATHNIS